MRSLAFILSVCCVAAAEPRRVAQDVLSLGAPTRDGKYLTHVKGGDLALRNLDTGQDVMLTHRPAGSPEFAYFSVPSRDGSLIAYAWFNEERFYELRIVDREGQLTKTLYRNPEAGFVQPCAFTPDGTKILTLFFRKDNTSQIALVSATDGSVEVLRSLQWVYPKRMDFAPDGRSIVYDSFRPDSKAERAVYLLPLDGSPERLLTPEPGSWLFPFFSLDGRSILYAGGDSDSLDIWSRPLAGGSPERLARNLGRALPLGITEGHELVFGLRSGASDVFVMNTKTKGAERIPTQYPGLNQAPVFSPDGNRLAYLSRRGPENYGQESRTVVLLDLVLKAERDLNPALAYIEALRWTEGGLVAQGSDGKGRGGAFRIDPDTGRVATLLVQHGAPFRGFAAALDAQGGLYSLREGKLFSRSPGGVEEELSAARDFALAGKQLAILERGGKLRWRGPGFENIWDCEDCEQLSLGRALITVRKSELWSFPADGSVPKRIGGIEGMRGPVSVSPSGARIAFTIGRQRDEVHALPLPRRLEIPLGLDRHLPVPPENPLTPEKVALGKKLFFDKRLSRDESTACASCHRPDYAFADEAPLAVGIRQQQGTRRTPRIANRAWGRSFFWDGRAKSLEEQVLGPIGNPLEMDLDPTVAARRVGLTVIEMQHALASYVRTILSGDSTYDRYSAGAREALKEDEAAGLALFRGKANCTSCHLGPNFSDEEFHFTGLGDWNGRGFKTPGLRDAARTPPYMHDGSLATLEDVVRFYNEGGRPHPSLDPEMQPLQLSEKEQRQLVAFLKTLNGRIRDGY